MEDGHTIGYSCQLVSPVPPLQFVTKMTLVDAPVLRYLVLRKSRSRCRPRLRIESALMALTVFDVHYR